jgi:hypothetical protein
VIFGWETLTDVDPGGATNMKPVGLQTNLATDEVFSALGSVDNVSGATNYVDIIVARPTSARLNTTLQYLGKYGTGSVNGRIAEVVGGTATNTDTFAGSATKGVRGGNANLSQMIDVGDLAILGSNYNELTGTNRWQDADFTGEGNVDVGDLAVLGANYNQADPNWTTPGSVGGSGSGSTVGVPEPTTLLMLAVSGLFAGMFRRGRR